METKSGKTEQQAPVQVFHHGWKTIYPVYINTRKTIAEGRRVSRTYAADNPTLNDIAEVAKHFGLKAVVQV
jgi:signal recognition particle subunit SRP19